MNFSGGKLESQGGRSGLPLRGVGSGAQTVQKDLDIILMGTRQTLAAGYLRVMMLPLVLLELGHQGLMVRKGVRDRFYRLILDGQLLPAAGTGRAF